MTLHPGSLVYTNSARQLGEGSNHHPTPQPLEHQLYDTGPGTPYLIDVGILGVLADLAQGRKHKLPVTANTNRTLREL